MDENILNNLLVAIRSYSKTMTADRSETREPANRRFVNSIRAVTRTTYTHHLTNGMDIKLNAKGQPVVLGANTDRKQEVLAALTELSGREDLIPEDERAEITSTIATLSTAIQASISADQRLPRTLARAEATFNEEWAKTQSAGYYANLRNSVENVSAFEDENRDVSRETTAVEPGVVNQDVENMYELRVNGIRFLYDTERNMTIDPGVNSSVAARVRTESSLRELLARDAAETDPNNRLTNAQRATIDRLLRALSVSLGREVEEPQQESEDVTYVDTDIVRRDTIEERIAYYEEIIERANNPITPATTTISREDARRYQEINSQRDRVAQLREQVSLLRDAENALEDARRELRDAQQGGSEVENEEELTRAFEERRAEYDELLERFGGQNANDIERQADELHDYELTADEIRNEIANGNPNADRLRALQDLLHSLEYREIVNNRTRQIDDLIEERRNTLESRRNEIDESRTEEQIREIARDYRESRFETDQAYIRRVLRANDVPDEEIEANMDRYSIGFVDGAEDLGDDSGTLETVNITETVTRDMTPEETAELEALQTEIDRLEAERDNLINADITRTQEEEIAYIDNMEGISNETKDRLKTLMSTYQYTITTEAEREDLPTPEELSDAQIAIDELNSLLADDLLHTAPEGYQYVLKADIDERTAKYTAELEEINAQIEAYENGEGQISPDDTRRATLLRARMADILGINPLNGIENENEHAIQYQLDDNEIDRFQELREELETADSLRATAIRIEMAEILGRDPSEELIAIDVEHQNEHAIQYQLDDNEIDEFQTLRNDLNNITSRESTRPDVDIEVLRARQHELEIRIRVLDELEKDKIRLSQEPNKTPEKTPEPAPGSTPEPTAEPTSEPTPEPTPGSSSDPAPEPTSEPPTEPAPKPDQLTTRGFWRIVADTSFDGKQATSGAITLRNLAHARLGPTPIKDHGIGWFGLPMAVVMLPIKLGAKAVNAIGNRKTDQQYQEMYEKLRDLHDNHPDEWNILMNGEAGPNGEIMYGLVHSSTARQYKLNDLYLQAVMAVSQEDTMQRIGRSNRERATNQQEEERANQLMQEVREGVINRVGNRVQINGQDFNDTHVQTLLSDKTHCTPTKLSEIQAIEQSLINAGIYTQQELDNMTRQYQTYRQARNTHSTEDIVKESSTEKEIVEPYKAVERAIWRKSHSDNYGPTFPILKLFSRKNPDNRDLIEEMADRHDAARAARSSGDEETARDNEYEMKKALERETNDKHIGSVVITRGKAHREKATVIPDDVEDTRARQLIANIALAASMYTLGTALLQNQKIAAEQARLDQEHATHNANLDQVNANNAQVSQEYQDALDQVQSYIQNNAPDQSTYEAFKTVTSDNIQGILQKYHESFTVSSNQVRGGSWDFVKDGQVHEMVESMSKTYSDVVKQADSLAQAGDYGGAIDTILQFNNTTVEPEVVSCMQYNLDTLQQAVASASQYSSTYQAQISNITESLSGRGNLSDLLAQASSSVTVPTVNGTIQTAGHVGNFTFSIPSVVVPSVATLGATIGNALFSERLSKKEKLKNQQNKNQNSTQQKDHDNDEDER